MYPTENVKYAGDENTLGPVSNKPQAFTTIDQCFAELERMHAKLEPVLTPGIDKNASAPTPALTELDARLLSLHERIRELSKRVKL
jgi:hypothetical protein